jgi:demethylmenaquinone methyltransferase/2-methoxy-6-polyprenyl-1,4-benzoquinol methylase
MSENHGIDLVRQFFSGTGATYDHVVNLCTIGMDRGWKKRIVKKIPRQSAMIMDLACGTGILTFRIARTFSSARIVGVDVTPEYLEVARRKAGGQPTRNIQFILSRAEDVCLQQGLDCIVSSYLAKYAELPILVAHGREMLRRGGVFVMHDFTYPPNRTFARLWESYFVLLQTAGARRYPEWKAAFDGLPELLRRTAWVQELTTHLHENGFSGVTVEFLTFGTSAIVSASKA